MIMTIKITGSAKGVFKVFFSGLYIFKKKKINRMNNMRDNINNNINKKGMRLYHRHKYCEKKEKNT